MRLSVRSIVPVLVLSTLPVSMLPGAAYASWSEGGATILSLDELMPRVGTLLGASARTSLPGDRPVLLPLDADPDSPKTIQIALVQSGLALRSEAGGWTVIGATAQAEADRARTRIRPIVSLAPRGSDAGRIQSGGVVLFGEVIAPPYLVEVAGDAVEINGVAVFPVLGADVTPPNPTRRQVETHDTMDAALKNFEGNAGSMGRAEAKRILAADLSRLPGVSGAEWLDDENVRLIRPGGDGEIITIARTGREADPPTVEQQREALTTQADLIRRALEGNATVFCGATYLLTDSALDAEVVRGRIDEILRSGEPDLLKLARLQAYTGHRDAAADLLYARVR